MRARAINILDVIDEIGLSATEHVIAGFSTSKTAGDEPLNIDIENFLKKNAIQFTKEKKSITYLVMDEGNGYLLGYFTLAHKAIEVPPDGLSRTKIRSIEKYAQLHKKLNAYNVSAFLIAQFGKNYNVEEENRISGDDLMKIVNSELYKIQHRIGGGVKYLDCEADAKLIRFYQKEQNFTLYGERLSEKDGKRYLQYLKFF